MWTWVAIDADTKLVASWMVGQRDAGDATGFIQDLADRLANRVPLTSDGLKFYIPQNAKRVNVIQRYSDEAVITEIVWILQPWIRAKFTLGDHIIVVFT